MTVEPPIHDELESELVPECDNHRSFFELKTSFMEMYDCSMPQAERKMEQYTLAQCEYLIRERWGVYDER